MRHVFHCLCLVGIMIVSTAFAETIENPPIVDEQYVTVQDGHLSYGGQRIRFWGTCFCCGPKRSGKDMELSMDRLCDAGFNAVRLNLTPSLFGETGENPDTSYDVPASATKDSRLDRLDYAIYLARQRGVFFWLQFCRWKWPFTEADYDLLPDDGTREQWNELVRTRKIGDMHLPYLSNRAGRIQMEFAKQILDHVNPYTQRRYGDEETIALWEMNNEHLFTREIVSGLLSKNDWPDFVVKEVTAKWNRWLLRRYKNEKALKKAWGSLQPGESLVRETITLDPMPKPENVQVFDGPGYQPEVRTKSGAADGYSARRREDMYRFLCFLYQDYNNRFIQYVRTLGKGIAKVPIMPTGSFQRNLVQYYSLSTYDAVTNGTYGFACRPWEIGPDNPLYPFISRVNGHPLMGQPTDVMRVAGKPYLIYECGEYRPNPYMAEYPMRIATQLISQDADGAFFFYWDDSGAYPKVSKDEDVLTHRLPQALKEYPNNSLPYMNDEVYIAALKSAGAIFRQANLPRPERTKVVIGGDRLFDQQKMLMGEAELWMRHFAWRTGVEVEFDPEGTTKIPAPQNYKEEFCKLGQYILFDWSKPYKGYIRIDAPTCKAFVGFNPPELTFGDVKITGLNRPFTSICVVAEDGKPLAESTSILITAVANSENTGFKTDPAKMKSQWAEGLTEFVVDPGTTPIIVNRISATITAPWLKGRTFQKHDFLRKVYAEGTLDSDTFVISADEPLFYARVTRSE